MMRKFLKAAILFFYLIIPAIIIPFSSALVENTIIPIPSFLFFSINIVLFIITSIYRLCYFNIKKKPFLHPSILLILLLLPNSISIINYNIRKDKIYYKNVCVYDRTYTNGGRFARPGIRNLSRNLIELPGKGYGDIKATSNKKSKAFENNINIGDSVRIKLQDGYFNMPIILDYDTIPLKKKI